MWEFYELILHEYTIDVSIEVQYDTIDDKLIIRNFNVDQKYNDNEHKCYLKVFMTKYEK